MKKKILEFFLVSLIIMIGAGSAIFLFLSRKPPIKEKPQVIAPLVKVVVVHQQDIPVIIQGYGTVKPKNQIQLIPQVSGIILATHTHFVSGGFFRAGDLLIQIDPTDYKLALQKAQAIVAGTRVILDLEKAKAEVARKEWAILTPNIEPPPLVAREPQIKQARAELRAAQAGLMAAKLNLERTSLSLPFDGCIVEKKVDAGQYVMAGQSVGTVYGTKAMEVPIPLENKELAWFNIPASATVKTNYAGEQLAFTGQVVRTGGKIDPATRLVSVVIEVISPFQQGIADKASLVPGMFVEASIQGKILHQVIPIPRYAVHQKNQVWIIQEDRLLVREVKIIRYDQDYAYVAAGLKDKDLIITSSLDAVTEGMKIRYVRGSE